MTVSRSIVRALWLRLDGSNRFVLRSGVPAVSVRADRIIVTPRRPLSAGLYPVVTSPDCTLRLLLRVTEVPVERLEVTDLEPLLVVPLLCTSTVLGRETKRVRFSETRPEDDTFGLLCVWRGGLNACPDLLLLSVRLTTGCRGAGELA